MQAPNLTQAGYTLDSRRLVTRGTQEFVKLKYVNSSKDAINLYMKTRWEKDAPTIEFAQNDGQSIAYWQEGRWFTHSLALWIRAARRKLHS